MHLLGEAVVGARRADHSGEAVGTVLGWIVVGSWLPFTYPERPVT